MKTIKNDVLRNLYLNNMRQEGITDEELEDEHYTLDKLYIWKDNGIITAEQETALIAELGLTKKNYAIILAQLSSDLGSLHNGVATTPGGIFREYVDHYMQMPEADLKSNLKTPELMESF